MSLSFSAPSYLYALLSVPLALLLAIFARRERRIVVPSLLPWKAVLALPSARPPKNPLDRETLYAVLVPLLAALALAEPHLSLPDHGKKKAILVVDDSLSMKSQIPGKPSRLHYALTWIQRIAEANPDLQFTLFLTSSLRPIANDISGKDAPTALQNASFCPQRQETQAEVLRVALESPWPTDQTPTTEREGSTSVPIFWISDRRPPIVSPKILPILVGDPSENVGFTAAERIPGTRSVFLAVGNFSSQPRRVRLNGGSDIDKTLTLEANGVDAVTIENAFFSSREDEAISFTLTPLDSPDDLPEDNAVTIPPLTSRKVAIDDTLYPRVGLALSILGNCSLLPLAHAAEADLLATDQEFPTLPQRGILLLTPATPCYGLIDLGEPQRVSDPRLWDLSLPPIVIGGLGEFSLCPADLPPGAKVWATARWDEKVLPWCGEWEWQGKKVIWLGAIPQEWTATPNFAVMMAEILDRLLPRRPLLPGLEESDNRLPEPPTQDLPFPSLSASTSRSFALSSWLLLLAFFFALLLARAEFIRYRTLRPSPPPHHIA